jgi:hypothetical protein
LLERHPGLPLARGDLDRGSQRDWIDTASGWADFAKAILKLGVGDDASLVNTGGYSVDDRIELGGANSAPPSLKGRLPSHVRMRKGPGERRCRMPAPAGSDRL